MSHSFGIVEVCSVVYGDVHGVVLELSQRTVLVSMGYAPPLGSYVTLYFQAPDYGSYGELAFEAIAVANGFGPKDDRWVRFQLQRVAPSRTNERHASVH